MSKELEALNFINNFLISQTTDTPIHTELCNACDLLRTALERKEKLERALEIIKEKRVNVWTLFRAGLKRYNNEFVYQKERQLTEEEYELLKEVLL